MEKGDFVIYIGKNKCTSFTPDSMFGHLTLYELYRIIDIMMREEDHTRYLLISHDDQYELWYPIENFAANYKKYFINKYDLR